ncbi:hypothetical protein Pelo_19473 [Pelomyxa schiedti]|nr:hypothetical protein Pelo_19473 [Pelomyxa schiedti]
MRPAHVASYTGQGDLFSCTQIDVGIILGVPGSVHYRVRFLEKADMRAPFDTTVMLVALLPQAGTVQPMQDENGQYWEYLRRLSLISGCSLAHAPSYHAPPGVGEPRLGKRTCYVLLASVE